MADEIDESASMTVRRMEKGHYDFVVRNYSLRKGIGVGKVIESEEFVVGGHRWTICFYPDGKNADVYNAGNASLFVFPTSPNCVIDCVYDLYMIDQSGKGNHDGVSLMKRVAVPIILSVKGRHLAGYLHFTKRANLESPYYLKDDCLKFSCTIGVFTCHVQNLPLIKAPKSNIRADFGKLLESKIGADVLFKVEDEKFWAHKFILAASSPLLRSRLSDFHQSQEIVIPEMESKIFKAILLFIYTGSLQEEEQESDSNELMVESFMAKMLVAADRFELESLKKLCESYFLERVSEESVAYLLYLADLCHATELKVACLRFAVDNQYDVLRSDGCEYLKRACPTLFLKLAGYEENPSCGEGTELDFCSKILFSAKESLSGFHWPWISSHNKCKLKEA